MNIFKKYSNSDVSNMSHDQVILELTRVEKELCNDFDRPLLNKFLRYRRFNFLKERKKLLEKRFYEMLWYTR